MTKQSLFNRARSMACVASLALASLCLVSASQAQSPQPPPLNGIAHIAIRVHSLEASRDFYKKLGFAEAFALSKDGVVYQSFFKINDRQFMEIYPATAKATQLGFLHLCFESDDLNAVYQDYIKRGLTPTHLRKAGAGNLLFTMKGPMQADELQNIEYTQYMPGSRHYNDRGKDLGPDRVGTKLVLVTLAMQDPAAAEEFYTKKLEFTPDAHHPGVFDLPGTSGEKVDIVPLAELGAKSSIMLTSPDIRRTGELLKSNGIPFTDGNSLTVTDPDGNLIHIIPAPGTFSHKKMR